jgi:hypothetical protein
LRYSKSKTLNSNIGRDHEQGEIMNRMNGRKCWTLLTGIGFIVMALFFMPSCSGPTPTSPSTPASPLVPATAIASAPTDTPTITSPPKATDTPTPTYPAPILVSPADRATIIGEQQTEFSWQWYRALQQGEEYDLKVWRSGKACSSVSIQRQCNCLLDNPPDGFGHYLWQVAVVRDEEGNESILSESLIWSFVWSDVPPTSTPTATPTPTPKPDAVVNTANLNLRSGPSTDYEILGVLKQGDPLKITGKDSPGDWLKVIAPDGEEGWVAAWLLEINLDISGVLIAQAPPTPTPMYTPTPTETPTPELLSAPTLLDPEDGKGDFTGSVDLKWQWEERPLEQDEYFSLRVYNEEGECHHTQVKEPAYVGGLSYCPTGEYYWQVAMVRKLCEECPNEQKWRTISQPSEEEWLFRYQTVEPDQPWEPPEPPKKPPKKPPKT